MADITTRDELMALADGLAFAASNTEGCLYSQRKLLNDASDALRLTASAPGQPQPAAWQFWTGECWILCEPPDARELRDDPEKFRPLYTSAPGEQQPVAWIHEDELPASYPYGAMFKSSKVRDGVRMFPVYTSAPPAAGWNVAVEALEIIAGERQCIDNLMGHADIAAEALSALRREAPASSGVVAVDLTPEQIFIINDMIHAWIDENKIGEFREAFRHDCKRLLKTAVAPSRSDAGCDVRVEQLEWRDHRPDAFPEPAWSAQTPFGFYNIEEVSASDSPAYVVRLHAHHFVADKDDLEDANAAAQADYERRILSALSKPAPVQDTHLVCGSDLRAMSGSVESDRVIQLHFKRKVTDRDRAWLLEAINAKIAADRQPAPVAADASAEPALNWKLSDDAKARIAEINDNLRSAALNASNIVAGSSNASAEARLREDWKAAPEILLDQIAAIRDEYHNLHRDCLDQMEWHAAQGDSEETGEFSTEAERHASALLACNRILTLVTKFKALSAVGGEAKKSEGGCICQDQHRRGYCTEPGCPYAVRPSDPTADVKCEACSGTGRHMGRFSMNDPDCTYCNGTGLDGGKFRLRAYTTATPSDPTADTDVESRVRRILCDGWGMSVDSFMQRFTEAGIGFVDTSEPRGCSQPTADRREIVARIICDQVYGKDTFDWQEASRPLSATSQALTAADAIAAIDGGW